MGVLSIPIIVYKRVYIEQFIDGDCLCLLLIYCLLQFIMQLFNSLFSYFLIIFNGQPGIMYVMIL